MNQKIHNKRGYTLKNNQKGFSTILLATVAVVLVIVGIGFFVVVNRDSTVQTNDAVARVVDDTVVNGTPENAIKAVSEQVSTEIMAEDAAMQSEEDATKLEDSLVDELEGVADETNL